MSITSKSAAEAVTLVKTMLVNTYNVARLIEFSAQGVQIVEWVATVDSATTDECLGLNGLRWYMPDDPEDFASYVGVDHDVPFPGGVAHWNCRSTVVPVDEEGEVLDLPLPLIEVAT